MPDPHRSPSGDDPRVAEVARLSRLKRRFYIYAHVPVIAFLLLWALLAFIPGPLNSYAEDLCVRLLGSISSTVMGYGSGAVVFILAMALLLILKATGVRFPDINGPIDRLAELRKQLLAEGATPQQMGVLTRADWYRYFRRIGGFCLLLTGVVCGVMYAVDHWTREDESPVRNVTLNNDNVLEPGRFRVVAQARLDSAFEIAHRATGPTARSGRVTNISRVDHHGYTPLASLRFHNFLIVPLVPPSWRPEQPIQVFYRCDVACGFDVPKGSALLPKDVTVGGWMRRSALPLFAKNTFERAGVKVASPYYVLSNVVENSPSPMGITALIGLFAAGFFFALPLIGSQLRTKHASSDVGVAIRPPMPEQAALPEQVKVPPMRIIVNRSSVSMGDDEENHERTLEIPPSGSVLDLLREAEKVCPLGYVGSKATWIASTIDQDRKTKRVIGVVTQQWSQPKLAISADETAASLIADGAVGVFFFYRAQDDPEAVFQALLNPRPAPPPFVATGTIRVDGQDIPIREIKIMREWHARLFGAVDGSAYLEYPVSVGPYKIDIAAFQKLSPEALAADQAGSLDLGKLSRELSEYAQETGKYERDRPLGKTLPEGSPVMSAWRKQDTIFVLFANGVQTQVDLNTVSNISLSVTKSKPRLYFRHECSWEVHLPLGAPGADAILQYVRQLPGFDEGAFQAALARTDGARITVLSRPMPVNARLLAGVDEEESRRLLRQDLDLGFRHVASGEHIPWSMTMDAAMTHFGLVRGGYRDGSICVGPVCLGALRIDKISASAGIYRSDIPLTTWSTPLLFNEDSPKANGELLNGYLRSTLGKPDGEKFNAYAGETETTWGRGGVSISVTYREPTLKSPQTGLCRFELRNQRPYPEYLTDTYCASVLPSDVQSILFWVPHIKLSGWYALSRYVRATPPGLLGLLSDAGNYLVWIDRDGSHAGFADRSFAAVFPRASMTCILLQNAIAERGGGRFSTLSIQIAGETRTEEAGGGYYGEFDTILDEIGKLLGLPVKKLEDLVDV